MATNAYETISVDIPTVQDTVRVFQKEHGLPALVSETLAKLVVQEQLHMQIFRAKVHGVYSLYNVSDDALRSLETWYVRNLGQILAGIIDTSSTYEAGTGNLSD